MTRFYRGQLPRAHQLARLQDEIRRGRPGSDYTTTGESGPTGTLYPSALPAVRRSEAFPWDLVANGWRAAGTNLTLCGIELQWGADAYTLTDQTVAIPTGGLTYYVGLEFDGDAITVPSPASDKASLRPSDSVYRCWLFGFRVSGGAIALAAIGHVGVVELDASWGPP